MMNLIRVNLRHWLHNRMVWALAGIAFLAALINGFGAFHQWLPGDWEFKGEFYPVMMTVSALTVCAAGVLCINPPAVRRLQVIAGYTKMQVFFAELVPVLLFAVFAWGLQLPALLWCRQVISQLDGSALFCLLLGILLLFCIISVCSVWLTASHNRYLAAILLPLLLLSGSAYCNEKEMYLQEPKYIQQLAELMYAPETLQKEDWERVLVMVPEQNRMYHPEAHEMPERIFVMMPQSSLTAVKSYLEAGWIPSEDEIYGASERDRILEERAYWSNLSGLLPAFAFAWLVLLTLCGTEEFRSKDMN